MEKENKYTVTITFGDQGENHAGMQKIGKMVENGDGFTLDDLLKIKNTFESKNITCELIHLNEYLPSDITAEEAHLLIIRQPLDHLVGKNAADHLFSEQMDLEYDKKAKMRGRVVNKHARWNLCFSPIVEQEPDYENGKGRIIKYDSLPFLNKLYKSLEENFGPKASDLIAEGNAYYDVSKCGIGAHGDAERRKVVAVRLGAQMNICYHWYHLFKPIGHKFEAMLNHGDMYVMSEKTTGWDWKKSSQYTLRHAAGCNKYTKFE